MSVDQRYSVRKDVSLDILIRRPPGQTENCKTRNISMGGVFVEMTAEGLVLNTDVDVVLAVQQSSGQTQYRLSAEVVRITREGIALKFQDYDNRTYTALVNLLYTS